MSGKGGGGGGGGDWQISFMLLDLLHHFQWEFL